VAKATQGWAKKVSQLESLCSVKASGAGPKGEVFSVGGGGEGVEVSKVWISGRGLESQRELQQGLGSL